MKILQLPVPGNGGRLGNMMFGIASTIGLALRHGYTPRFPADWKYRDAFNIPDEWFGEMVPVVYNLYEGNYEYDSVVNLRLESINGNINISGYLQSPKYWEGYEKEIRQYLTPKGCKPGTKAAVAIHYRRDDYIGNPNYVNLPINYYTHNYLKYFANIPFMAFSDDPDFIEFTHPGTWCHDNDPIKELSEMASYQMHITANSTFSWWGAYLSDGMVIHPEEWFSGPLLHTCSVKDLFPEDWVEGKPGRPATLDDVTFTIPVSYDHPDRLENLKLVKNYLQTYFDCPILVGEVNTNQMDADVCFDYNGKFHRTKALNELTRMAKTPYVVNYDADVLFSPWQLIEMVKRLRAGIDMVYPYDGTFLGIGRENIPNIKTELTGLMGKRQRTVMHSQLPVINVWGSVGGAVGFNKAKYMAIGGENENMVSWAPEDVERYWRAKMFGLTIERVKGPLFHIDHYRSINSGLNNPDSIEAHKYWDWLQRLNKEQVTEHLKINQVRGNSGGWKLEDAIKEHAFSLELAYHIWQLNKHKTFYDLGAGPGFYTHFLQQRGVTCWGFDVEPIKEIELTNINTLDISKPCGIVGKADVVLCLEVGEHIEPEFESVVMNNICQLARQKIIMSWAIPGQGGFGHVNVQPNDYIIEAIESRGWAYNEQESTFLRQRCSGCSWFENTLMVFDKK